MVRKYHSCAADRVVIKSPVQKIEKVIYEKKIRRIWIRGSMCSRYYDDYMEGKTCGAEEYRQNVFTTFDYYETSLIRYLQENLKVNVEMG